MKNKRYWMCIIGPASKDELPSGASAPLREATRKAFEETLGREDDVCYAGWGMGERRMREVLKLWCKS